MKKILASLVFMIIPFVSFSQGLPNFTRNYNFSSATTAPTGGQFVGGLGYGFYKLKWEVLNGTLSACTVSLQGDNGQALWTTNIIGNQTCTSDGETILTTAGTVTALFRVNVSTLTLSSPGTTLNVTVSAWNEVTGATATNPFNINTESAIATTNPWNCTVTLSSNTTTQCQAAPSTGKNYVTGFIMNTTTGGTTGSTIQPIMGTGSNCGSSTANLSAIAYPNTSVAVVGVAYTITPLIPTALFAICFKQAGGTAGTTVVEAYGINVP